MKILFIDESKSRNNSFIVVGGLFIDSELLFPFEEGLKGMLDKYELTEPEDIRKKHIKRNLREQITKDIYLLLKKYHVSLIASVINGKDKFIGKINSILKIYQSPTLTGTYLIIERFYFELKKEDQKGIIYYDKAKDKQHLLEVLYNTSSIKLDKSLYETNLNKMISSEELLKRIYALTFLDNKKSFSMQMSDLIVGALREAIDNYLKEKDNDLINLEENLENLRKYFYAFNNYYDLYCKNDEGRVKGYGIKVWL